MLDIAEQLKDIYSIDMFALVQMQQDSHLIRYGSKEVLKESQKEVNPEGETMVIFHNKPKNN